MSKVTSKLQNQDRNLDSVAPELSVLRSVIWGREVAEMGVVVKRNYGLICNVFIFLRWVNIFVSIKISFKKKYDNLPIITEG